MEQPQSIITIPSMDPSVQCHPCHYTQENDLFAVAQWRAGLIAVGLITPPTAPNVFTSADGVTWQLVNGVPTRDPATSNAVTTLGDRTVMVGSEHNGATAWAFDGASWQQAPEQDSLFVEYAAGAMNAVVGLNGQFVAGGFADEPLHDVHIGAAWRSSDGLAWTRDDDKGVFQGGRIWGMATSGETIVAVGTSGDEIYGPAGAWRWTASTGWERARIQPNDGGAMAAVSARPEGGFIAVGKNSEDLGAAVWMSDDGLTWTAVADQPAFHFYLLPLRMQSIVATPHGYFVGGWRSDQGKGSAVVFRSADGQTWSDSEWQTTFSGGQASGVAVTGDRAVIVGRTGYPDWNRATIWTRTWPY